MAKIQRFFGYRPPKNIASKVASVPYDVLNSDEAREMAAGNPDSFLHINKPEIDLDPSIGIYEDIVYQTAVNNLKRFIDDGILVRDDKACLYAYQQIMDGHKQLGLMASSSVEDYNNDKIKKHEKTRKEKEDDRARHVAETNCNAGPVFLTYRANDEIDALMKSATSKNPDVDFVAEDGIQHTLWIIDDDELIGKIEQTFKDVDYTYVADGHHRAKSGSRVAATRQKANPDHTGKEEYNFFLSVLFPHNQLKILDYNRVVKDLNGHSKEDLLEKIGELFEISETGKASHAEASPNKVQNFGMYLDKKWYRLVAKAGSFDKSDPVKCLDVSILQNNLLTPLLNIQDPRTDKRIDFVGGIRGMAELEKRVDKDGWAIAFAMYPTTMNQLMDIADAGEIMPPKSTWFEPKLRSGLVVHLLD